MVTFLLILHLIFILGSSGNWKLHKYDLQVGGQEKNNKNNNIDINHGSSSNIVANDDSNMISDSLSGRELLQ